MCGDGSHHTESEVERKARIHREELAAKKEKLEKIAA
jgi:hypothetical protein